MYPEDVSAQVPKLSLIFSIPKSEVQDFWRVPINHHVAVANHALLTNRSSPFEHLDCLLFLLPSVYRLISRRPWERERDPKVLKDLSTSFYFTSSSRRPTALWGWPCLAKLTPRAVAIGYCLIPTTGNSSLCHRFAALGFAWWREPFYSRTSDVRKKTDP